MLLKRDPNYRRLKLGGRGLFNTASYWLGSDHLLVVEVANYVERYRRFHFRDVLGISIQGTRRRFVWALVLGVLLILVSIPISLNVVNAWAWDQPPPMGEMIALSATLGVPGIVLLVLQGMNLARGPGGVCFVHTEVQKFRLPRVTRWRQAERLVETLAPLIEAAQAAGATAKKPDSRGDAAGPSIAGTGPGL